ncbi:MAG: acetate kinase [Tissierellia bacterium]|nr:acetate kinase [Tissierellia bacterium]
MNVLVINCGSSSLKFQLLNMEDESLMASGLVERIAIAGSQMILKTVDGEKHTVQTPMEDHSVALKIVLDALVDPKYNIIKDLKEIDAVGHRVVHAGEEFANSVIVDDEVLDAVERCVELAPLHNPPNLLGIRAIQSLLPGVPNVAVFDTAFHQTMPPEAYIYPLPYEWYEDLRIRRYGFHGTSHKYVAEETATFLGKNIEDLKIITCHLGNGSSITAVDRGKSVDTSMGFTPMEGLVMGTRVGFLDPAIISFLQKKTDYTTDEITHILNNNCGVLGISCISSDFRDLDDAASVGDKKAQLALDIFRRTVKKTVAGYAAIMGGVDAIVFTGGIGENSITDRAGILSGMEFMGVTIDDEKNQVRGKAQVISKDDGKVAVVVMPTNEELAIAKDTKKLVEG